jgi:hypothetical protein
MFRFIKFICSADEIFAFFLKNEFFNGLADFLVFHDQRLKGFGSTGLSVAGVGDCV